MAKLAFYDYHNMVVILEKTKYNIDFHWIVDFLEASRIRYALTVRPTIYVSHIRQFWSTTRVETTDGETKILAKSKVPSPRADETAFPKGDVRYGEAFPTDTSLDAGQYAIKTLGIDGYLYQPAKETLTYGGKGSVSRPRNHSVEEIDKSNEMVAKYLSENEQAEAGLSHDEKIVDFVEAFHIRYALTINPTVYVSHIRQFWSTARIKTTDEGTKILATVDGKLRTIFESSTRRNLKLNDEEGISTLPDVELFANLALIGYIILPNQKFTFQKGLFSHQWKYLIHTIMQRLSPKSTSFNEFSSNIATAVVRLATDRVYKFLKMIFDGMVRNVNNKVSKFFMCPRFLPKCLKMGQFGQIAHTHMYAVPFHTRKVLTTLRVNSPSFSGWTVPLFATMLVHQGEGSRTPTEPHHTPSPEAQQSPHTAPLSTSLPPATTATIPTSTPTEIPILKQYSRRARIAQSSALPTAADEPASPLGDDSLGEACPTVSGLEAGQDRANIVKTSALPHESTPRVTSLAADEGNLEISNLKARIKMLEDNDRGGAEPSGEDAPIKGRSLETGEEAANILTSRVQVVSVPPATEVSTVGIPTGSGMVPTASPIFTTTSVVTPYSRRKGKEKMVESDTPKKKKLQEQIDVQMLIDGLDRNNETIDKYLQEHEQFGEDLSIEEKIDMINELVKYQGQSQQSKPLSKKQQREFYMSVLKSHLGWKTKHFKGMTLDEIREKFILVWKQIEDFVPMASKEEGERFKRKGLRLEQDNAKKVKAAEDVSEKDLKEMMQLVPVEEVYVEALQTLVKETLSIRQATSDKEKELWVELKSLFEPDVEDQLWIHTQALMHDPVEWRLYDSCGVHHVLLDIKKFSCWLRRTTH
nr:hypothetical protein [Tanacetum cinerariifolium]